MAQSLGELILNAVQRAEPMLLHGKNDILRSTKFSLTNPYILEALPEQYISHLSIFEGKKLRTVFNVLDNPDYANIIKRYRDFIPKYKIGFNEQEIKQLWNKACIQSKRGIDNNVDAIVYLSRLNGNKAMNFDAHGIAKGSVPEQLRSLNQLLSQGIDKTRTFYTAPLGLPDDLARTVGAAIGTGGGCAYRDGSFILVSGKGKKLINDGIEHVIVNDAYYNIIEDLAAKFPKIHFVKAENAAEYFNKVV